MLDQAAKAFGAQCVVVSIDAVRKEDGSLEVFIDGGKTGGQASTIVDARQSPLRVLREGSLKGVTA